MAKKNKKDAEENIDSKEEFNEIDENFGLPDLDMDASNDSSEENVAEEEDESDSSSNEYSTTQEEDTEEETPVNSQFEEEESSNEEDDEEEKPAYVPGTYAAKAREEESNAGKIIGVIVLILIVGAGLWYFYSYRPTQIAAEKAKKEQIAADKAKKEQERIAAEKAAEEERLRQEEEARLQEIEDAKPKIGTIETISERTSRYYVVVSSGLDGDLAMDYAKKEVNNGTNIKLLSPLGTNKFYRVTVADYDTWVAAENAGNELKSTFGDGVWVLKY